MTHKLFTDSKYFLLISCICALCAAIAYIWQSSCIFKPQKLYNYCLTRECAPICVGGMRALKIGLN